jgi:hypothetical protein
LESFEHCSRFAFFCGLEVPANFNLTDHPLPPINVAKKASGR